MQQTACHTVCKLKCILCRIAEQQDAAKAIGEQQHRADTDRIAQRILQKACTCGDSESNPAGEQNQQRRDLTESGKAAQPDAGQQDQQGTERRAEHIPEGTFCIGEH